MRTANQPMEDILRSLGCHDCDNPYCEGSVNHTMQEFKHWQEMIDDPPDWLKVHLDKIQLVMERQAETVEHNNTHQEPQEDEIAQVIPTPTQLVRIRYSHSDLLSLMPTEDRDNDNLSGICAPKQRKS